MKNKLKEKLEKGAVTIGTWITIGHPEISEILSNFPFDWIMFDLEHTPLEIDTVQNLLQAMSTSEISPVARVAWNDKVLIKRVLDIGISSVVVPMVNNVDDAVKVVQACKYPPEGTRGCGPRRASRYGLSINEYISSANEEILVGVQIETREALDNLDAVASVKGVDMLFAGPMDLSVSLGCPGQFDNPDFNSELEKISQCCIKHNISAGTCVSTAEDLENRISEGYNFSAFLCDYQFLMHGCRETFCKALKECFPQGDRS